MASRKGEQVRSRGAILIALLNAGLRRRFLQNHMSVCSAKAKGAYPGNCRTTIIGPRTKALLHAKRDFRKGNIWVWRPKMQARRYEFMLECQRRLDQSSYTGSDLQM